MAHEQPLVLARTLRHLRGFPCIVHVDARRDERPFVEATKHLDVDFVPRARRVPVTWAAFSQCVATFPLMEQVLPLTAAGEHIMLLSGTCYPIRPVEHLTEHLLRAPTSEHIRFLDVDDFPAHFGWQLDRRHFRDLGPIGQRSDLVQGWKRAVISVAVKASGGDLALKRPEGLRIAHGQTEWALTREAVDYVLNHRSPKLDEYFRYTFAPDEKYVHTLIGASPFAASTPAGGFESRKCPHTQAMASLHYVPPDWGRFLDDRDWPAIDASPAYFTRKMGLPDSGSLLPRVDRRIEQLRNQPEGSQIA
jgi:hypothetical protein